MDISNLTRFVQQRGTKAEVEGFLGIMDEAAFGYANDTHEIGIYTSGTWLWVGGATGTISPGTGSSSLPTGTSVAYVGQRLFNTFATATGSFTIANISGTYDYLELFWYGKSNSTGSQDDGALIALNGDTNNANYARAEGFLGDTHGSSRANDRYIADISTNWGVNAAKSMSSFRSMFLNYRDNGGPKQVVTYGGASRPSGSASAPKDYVSESSITWNNTGSITQIVISPQNGSGFLNTRCILVGYSLQPIGLGGSGGSVYYSGILDNPWLVAKEPSGFPNRTESLMTFDNSNRNFTIAPTGTSFDVYVFGVKHTKTSETKQISTATGIHYISYDSSGVLQESQTPFVFSTNVPVASIYWNGSTGIMGEERHGMVMDIATHEYLHETVGTRYASGLAGTFTGSAIYIGAGEYYDDDIEYLISSPVTQCRVFYRNGNIWNWTAGQTKYFHEVSNIIQYDNNGVLANVSNNNYVAYWIFATNHFNYPIISIMGQREDNNIANARANNTPEGLSFGTLPFAEMKLLYRVIVQRNGTDEAYIETLDYRTASNMPVTNYVPTDHGALTGLTDQDHPASAIFTDITSFNRILSASDSDVQAALDTLDNHSHAYISGSGAQGQIAFFASGSVIQGDSAFVWDNVNKYLGIGGTPTFALHIIKNKPGFLGLSVENTAPSGTAVFQITNNSAMYLGAAAHGSTFPGTLFGMARANTLMLYSSGGTTAIGTLTAHDLVLGANNAEVARASNDGSGVSIFTTKTTVNTGLSVLRATGNDANNWVESRAYGSGSAGTLFGLATANSVFYLASPIANGLGFGTFTNQPIIFGTNNTEKMRLTADGDFGIGRTAPQGKLHGYDTIGGFLYWEYDGVDGTARTIIPNGAGDVLYRLLVVGAVARYSDASLDFLDTAGVFNVNSDSTVFSHIGNTYNLRINADGSVDFRRTAGTLTLKVNMWLIWI